MAASTLITPSPENESGVTLIMPITYVRLPHSKFNFIFVVHFLLPMGEGLGVREFNKKGDDISPPSPCYHLPITCYFYNSIVIPSRAKNVDGRTFCAHFSISSNVSSSCSGS